MHFALLFGPVEGFLFWMSPLACRPVALISGKGNLFHATLLCEGWTIGVVSSISNGTLPEQPPCLLNILLSLSACFFPLVVLLLLPGRMPTPLDDGFWFRLKKVWMFFSVGGITSGESGDLALLLIDFVSFPVVLAVQLFDFTLGILLETLFGFDFAILKDLTEKITGLY